MHGVEPFDMLHATPAVTKTTGLTNAITQVVQLGTPSITTTNHFKLRDQRRMDRPSLLDTNFPNHATHGDVLVDATTLSANQSPLINLDALFVTFDNTKMDIDGVADIKARNIRLESVGID